MCTSLSYSLGSQSGGSPEGVRQTSKLIERTPRRSPVFRGIDIRLLELETLWTLGVSPNTLTLKPEMTPKSFVESFQNIQNPYTFRPNPSLRRYVQSPKPKAQINPNPQSLTKEHSAPRLRTASPRRRRWRLSPGSGDGLGGGGRGGGEFRV